MPYEYSHARFSHQRGQRGNQMSDVQRFNDEVQKAGKDGFDAVVSSFSEANKGRFVDETPRS